MVKEIVKLDNEKYIFLKKEKTENYNDYFLFDVKKDNLNVIKNNKNILLMIDFNVVFNNYEKIIKKILQIQKKCKRKKIKIGKEKENQIIIGILKNYNNENNQKILLTAINAILYNKDYDRYNYLYDKICEYLDKEFTAHNICNFKDDICIAKRDTDWTMGCCYHFKNKIIPDKLVLCEYLINKKCSVDCISCKLYTCPYLNKKGIKYKLNDILLIKCFFNPIQKLILKTRVFTQKEKILKEILFFNFINI